ncbi:MAG: transcription-repair coupling factor [Paludibacteraceae bacterium]|nr:transcription-repair coupling factor [Paludibacteraceae bacterium]
MIEKISKTYDVISGTGIVSDILKWMENTQKNGVLQVKTPATSYRSVLCSAISNKTKKTIVYLAQNEDSAGYAFQDIRAISNAMAESSDDSILFYPCIKGKSLSEDGRKIMQNRVLESLQNLKQVVIVTYPEAIRENVLKKETLKKMSLKICQDDTIDLQKLSESFINLGLERVDFVFEPGQFSVRGSIVDVFSFSSETPYRLDFFGDSVDSIRSFDITNQLSIEKLQDCTIVGKCDTPTEADADALPSYLPQDTIIITDDQEFVLAKVEEHEKSLKKHKIIDFTSSPSKKYEVMESFVSPSPLFAKNYEAFAEYIKKCNSNGKEVMIATENARQRERLETILTDLSRKENLDVTFIVGTLHNGFETDYFTILLEHEIFGRYHRYNLTNRDSRRGKEALTLRELKNLSIGDYVVHDDFGIGVFGGLVKISKNGYEEESVKINYKDGDILMVSLSALHKVSKYSGQDTAAVKVTKLGSARWDAVKSKTKQKLKDIARDLIMLYAMRKQEQGYAFSADSFLQAELESNFEFQDTPDQARATQDVKRDMESARPMDRLVCGDVGFGKTEIAVRAALKATTDNKQVAVLVPTTVLAFQHYKTFARRLKDMPVKVDYISRTRSSSEVKNILHELEIGNINILIGTHKLIGKNVKFHDLGLLIIDEEQKFGVAAKEKIKQMKVNVDTLTLTATPIPRTLQFSLLGARDLSVINTPPEGRYPIKTHLSRFDENLISKAIDFELRRGGQVLFVNNNIKELDSIKSIIVKNLPTTRVIIAHGRMSGEEIESNMLEFVQGDYDVLLSTSIIESGIDISNCNTILINNAQNFGLSDLHQLRGRVGRNSVQAYCYLFTPPLECMSDESRKRLEAITTYTELGSGLNIAMRDLDIRGAGNLLGAEQSGFIADLGFETYKKILAEAIRELRNGEFKEVYEDDDKAAQETEEILHVDCAIDSDFPSLFPEDYVTNITERLALYRELDSMQQESELDKFAKNMRDRFGVIPEAGENLIMLIRTRFLANKLGFERLNLKNGKAVAFLTPDRSSQYYQSDTFGRIIAYLGSHPHRCLLSENKAGKPYIQIADITSPTECYTVLKNILK